MFTLGEINFFFGAVIRGAWKTELGCSPGQSLTEKSPEVSSAAPSCSEMIRESDRSHSSRQDHPHPMGAVEAWKSFCLRVCVRVCAWGCNLRATRAGLSLGALKAKAKPLTCGWSWAIRGWLGGLPRGTRCCPAPMGCQGAGGGNTWVLPHLLALGLPLMPSTHGSPSRSWSHPGKGLHSGF